MLDFNFDKSAQSFTVNKRRRNCSFSVQAHVIQNPEKINCEDAFFISDDASTFGVADGVGIWSEMGTDPSIYSTNLLERIKDYFEEHKDSNLYEGLVYGYKKNMDEKIEGSSTVCLAQIKGDNLHILNLGDSGFAIFRDNEFKIKSVEQTHSFNYPYQLGAGGDSPSKAELFETNIEKDDLIVLATDGLFDNLYPSEMTEIIKSSDPDKIAFNLAVSAMSAACNSNKETPFSERIEAETDHIWNGGKMDDVTVITCRF